MIGRFYTVSFDAVAIAAVQDLFEITPAANKPVFIVGLTLDNVGGTADAGDAQEEMLRGIIRRGYATSGTGGSAATPRPLLPGTAAFSGTVEVNNITTQASAGTAVDLWPFGWNVRVPLRELFPDELAICATAADLTVVRLLAAPNDSITVSGSLFLCEMG